ncbi:YihY/virulence factor BrkB family protein [Desertifilum sp. FACHB-1129]|uniref:Ribonuclease BN n=1 Tax=Desertifilum tharense IPPAS B-1220 TaxID=1781255 RepID=A0A1E5QCM7_9CYAN|nr:YihY/virulence factor BrkB family protein [Desertifilum tharense]MBD2312120.1 YihY/virulence factor BrkB family protein [Desertifilum sp. FACHB-1129]MBD2322219.1 YihY/virulence factor BrkB family protein [Desertifilum sp. FACHB-866]MBD2332256.1 YihY/virulence factor BrkB family protein [Desertifilum sp. FACHB-868]MDA0210887.1 YihY/virulence factor BrkB family protein [Cyanobacteria bacterium FC1]OEJ72387.1 ribonuclease BN [Desertifilum tharense IPPAS B-1220]
MKRQAIWNLLKETFAQWQEDKIPLLAAALAYYTVFSLAPLLIIAIAIAGFVLGQDTVQTQLVEQLQDLIGREGAQAIRTMIDNAYEPTSNLIAAIIGAITLLFGATTVFAQLKEALNIIWKVTPQPGRPVRGFVKARLLSFTLVLGLGFLLLVSLLASAILAGISRWLEGLLTTPPWVWQLIDLGLSFSVITLLFALIYKLLPDAKIAWTDVGVGAAITSVLFTIGKFLIGLYLGNSGIASAYGAAGSFVVILIWIFYSAQLLLTGAEFTQVWANRYGSRIRPRRSLAIAPDNLHRVEAPPKRTPGSRRRKILKNIRKRTQKNQKHHQDFPKKSPLD